MPRSAGAKLDFERKATLLKTNVTSQAEFLNSEAAMKEAQAQFARTTVAIERAQAQAASAGANVKVSAGKAGGSHNPLAD